MKSDIAKNSELAFGEPYKKIQNKTREYYFCSVCHKKKNTNPYYYPSSNEEYLICQNCYNRLFQKNNSYRMKTAELLPKETVLYSGKKYHECANFKNAGFEKKYYRIQVSYSKTDVVPLYCCKSCGIVFVGSDQYKFALYKINSLKPKKNAVFEEKNNYTDVALKHIPVTEFLTRITVMHCVNNGHEIEDIKAVVKVLRADYTIAHKAIPAIYCKTCNKYYMLETDFQKLKGDGILLCNVVDEEYWKSSPAKGFYITNKESLLYKMGYNVNASENLSQSVRCSILKAAFENDLMTKVEILSHLDYLIHRSQHRAEMSEAVKKWRQDRDFVKKELAIKVDEGKYYEPKKIRHRVKAKHEK